MLEVMIVIAIFTAIIGLVDKPLINKIKNSTTAKDAVYYRKRLVITRYVVTILLFSLYIGGCVYMNFNLHGQSWYESPGNMKGIIMGVVLGIFELSRKPEHSVFSKVSTLDKDDILDSPQEFILYLRGFHTDDYHLDTTSYYEKGFSEYGLVKNLSKYLPVYAIGMTKEIECPKGAQRVYFSDSTWHDDVIDLMEIAKYIVVLIDDKPNCIWEIEQTRRMYEKTIYVVTNMAMYKNVVDHGALPYLSSVTAKTYFSCVNGKWHVWQYSSCDKIAKSILCGDKIKRLHCLPWLAGLAITVVWFFGVMFIVSNILSHENFKSELGTLLIFILFMAGFIAYKVLFGSRKIIKRYNNWLNLSPSLLIFSILYIAVYFHDWYRMAVIDYYHCQHNMFDGTVLYIISGVASVILYYFTIRKRCIHTLNALLALGFFEMISSISAYDNICPFYEYLVPALPGIMNIIACGSFIQMHYNHSIVPRHLGDNMHGRNTCVNHNNSIDFLSRRSLSLTNTKKQKEEDDSVEWWFWILFILGIVAQSVITPIFIISEGLHNAPSWSDKLIGGVLICAAIKYLMLYLSTKSDKLWILVIMVLCAVLNIIVTIFSLCYMLFV